MAEGEDFRVIHFTPPGSACSIITHLEAALRDAAIAHGRHEQELGREDPDWPSWYSRQMWAAKGDETG